MVPHNINLREAAIYTMMSLITAQPVLPRAYEVRERWHWTPGRLEQFRVERCRNILQHAASNVPYYRDLFHRVGFDPARFHSFSQLSDIPVLTRQHVRDNLHSLCDPAFGKRYVRSVRTGGTTGEPLQLFREVAADLERKLVTDRMYTVAKRPIGTPTLLIAGSPLDFQLWNSLHRRLKNRLFNVTVRSSFQLTPSTIKELIADIASRRYEVVIAYASVFDILASYAEHTGMDIKVPRIIACAEPVFDVQRERWQQIFDAEVFEIYGSREMVSIAGETPEHNGLVINHDIYHVEIVDGDGRPLPPGSPGLITITDLLDHAMPLIRYQLGDIGTLLDQPHTRAFPRLKITHGRLLDIIVCPSGKMLPGEFFPHLIKEVSEHVERFQVIQDELRHLTVRIQPRATWSAGCHDYLQERILASVGEEMRVDIEIVDCIEASASGKFRVTINLVPPEQRPWAL